MNLIRKIKTSTLMIFLLLSLSAMAQEPFVLQGKISNMNKTGRVYLFYPDKTGEGTTTDSTIITNGTFVFKGDVISVRRANVVIVEDNTLGKPEDMVRMAEVKGNLANVYLEKGMIQLNGTLGMMKAAKIAGTPANDDHSRLKSLLLPLEIELAKLNKEKKSDTYVLMDSQKRKAILLKIKTCSLAIDSIRLAFVKDNPSSFIAIVELYEILNSTKNPDVNKLIVLFEGLSNDLKTKLIGQTVNKSIQTLHLTQLGARPSFVTADVNGKPIQLTDYTNQYVLVEFWASWCLPCRAEIPRLKAAYQKYKDKNFSILSVSVDEHKEAWLSALKSENMPWVQAGDLKGELYLKYVPRGAIPFNFLLDPSGKIIAKDLRGEAIQKKLSELLD